MSLEDQEGGQEIRSVGAIALNPEDQAPTQPDQISTKIIKYSEIRDGVDSGNLNSDTVIEMQPLVSQTNSNAQISSSGSDDELRVSETALDMPPNEVLANDIDVSTVNPENLENSENPDQAPSVLFTNKSDK